MATAITDPIVDLARSHDHRVREIERSLVASWSELAEIAIQVRDAEEWKLLNFHSFNAWLADAAPRSRAMIYSAIGLLEELKADVPIAELRQIGIGNAHILKVLPKEARRKKDVLDAAKALPPRAFRGKAISAAPHHHIENWVDQRFRFTVSQWEAIDEAIEQLMGRDEDVTSPEEALEAICAEWVQEQNVSR